MHSFCESERLVFIIISYTTDIMSLCFAGDIILRNVVLKDNALVRLVFILFMNLASVILISGNRKVFS